MNSNRPSRTPRRFATFLFTLCTFGVAAASVGCEGPGRVPCEPGTWNPDDDGSTECVAHAACEAGEYVVSEGTATVDRTCAACAAGTYSSAANQAQCEPHVPCAGGTVETTAGTVTSPPVCAACVAGTYCAGGSAPSVACATGTFDDDGDPSTPCVAHTDCQPGSAVVADGTATMDRSCSACATGTFTTTTNEPTCAPWVPCAAGTVESSAGTATTQPVCTACAAGQHCAGGNATAVDCDVATTDWDDDGDPATSCQPRTDCDPGTYVASEGDATADRICFACPDGTYSLSTNVTSCTLFLPTVTFTSPVDGATITGARTVTVSGTFTGAQVTLTLVHDGMTLPVTISGQSFRADVVLEDLQNDFEITATNPAGAARSAVTVEYPYLALRTFQPASLVVGQDDFTTRTLRAADAGFAYYNWGGAFEAGGALYLFDYDRNRILGFDGLPTTNGFAPDFVVGQPDFTSTTGGTSSSLMDGPSVMGMHQGSFYVLEYDNSRIVRFDAPPTATGASALSVLGQVDLDSLSVGCSATEFDGPEGMIFVGDKLLVADAGNNRVLIWNQVPTSPTTPPDLVLGQADFVHCAADDDDQDGNPDTAPNARTLDYPTHMWSDGTRLILSDSDNHRVLIWNTFPTTSFQTADVVVGQADFASSVDLPSATGLSWPYAIASNGNQLFVGCSARRVMIWNSIPTASNAPADAVLGQSDFVHVARNDDDQDGVDDGNPSARTMTEPYGLAIVDDRLWVTDSDNARVIVFAP